MDCTVVDRFGPLDDRQRPGGLVGITDRFDDPVVDDLVAVDE